MRISESVSREHPINNFTTNGVVKRLAEARKKLRRVKNLKGAKAKALKDIMDISSELPNYLKRNI